MKNKGEIVIFKSPDNQAQVEVKFEEDTVWLTQKQMAELFDRNRVAITQHIGNIFKEAELDEHLVCKDFLHTTQHGAITGKMQKTATKYYNLDVIISVGYRVKSKRGTQFRIWATQRLKDYLVKGYAINQKRLEELGKMIQLIEQSGSSDQLQLQEAKGLLNIITHYTQSFVLLNQYDSNAIENNNLNENITYEIKYEEAKQAITELKKQLMVKKEATELFGNEKDQSFKSSLQGIVQTFGGQFLYPSIEEQAAHFCLFGFRKKTSTASKKVES